MSKITATLVLFTGLLLGALSFGTSMQESGSDAPRYDMGWARLSLENHTDRRDGEMVDAGWSLVASGRLDRLVPDGSILRYVVKKDGAQVAQMRARLDNNPNYGPAQVRKATDDEMRVQGAGLFEVDVHYLNNDTDEDLVLANHTIEVLAAQPKNEPLTHFINHTGDVLRAMVLRDGAMEDFSEGQPATGGYVHIQFMAAPSEYNKRDGKPAPIADSRANQLRCTVNGERLKLPEGGIYRASQEAVVNAYDGASRIRFSWVEYVLPVIWGTGTGLEDRMPTLEANPGTWELTLRSEDAVMGRTFRFEVRDGMIQPHPEEASGLYLGLGAHLTTVTIPEDETFETYVDPDAPGRIGICYGHKPSSPELKKTAAALPRLGKAPGSGQ